MQVIRLKQLSHDRVSVPPERRQAWLAAGGMLGAFASMSCCILPLVLFSLGLGGAWIGNLTALAPYQPIFIAVTLGFLGAGFWLVYLRPKPACTDGEACARPHREDQLVAGDHPGRCCPRLSLRRARAPRDLRHKEMPAMSRILSALGLFVALLASAAATAAERTVTLAVDGMSCASCP